jgi:hypothetical protein
MSVETVKSAILDEVKQTELCPDYQKFLIATTEEELIAAGYEHVEWAYSNGFINGNVLAGLDANILNEHGYYTTGTHNLVNPGGDIYVFGSAVVTVNLTLNNRCRIVICSDTASVIIVATGNAFFKIKRIKNTTPVSITLSDNASSICDFEGSGSVDVVSNGNSVFHATLKGSGTLTYSNDGSAAAVIKAYHDSSINIGVGTGPIVIKRHDQSVTNYEYNPET